VQKPLCFLDVQLAKRVTGQGMEFEEVIKMARRTSSNTGSGGSRRPTLQGHMGEAPLRLGLRSRHVDGGKQ